MDELATEETDVERDLVQREERRFENDADRPDHVMAV
jgi:hypothetical protein